jgi:hypothetical protein
MAVRPKEYQAKAVQLKEAPTWQASDNQAEGILFKRRSARRSLNMVSKQKSGQGRKIDYHREVIRKLISP